MSASDMLKTFCKWQGQLTTDKTYYDVALLLTRFGSNTAAPPQCYHHLLRENICRDPLLDNENCDTLGLAELATMCNDNSCAIVQDNGLSAAFTIAHELGHV